MKRIQGMMLCAALALSVESAMALPSIRLETAPTENQGAIEADELGPAFSRPLAQEEAKPGTPPQAPVEAKDEKKNELRSLFENEQKTAENEVNPLEELAKKEMKALNDPEKSSNGEQKLIQVGENDKQTGLDILPENAPREVDLEAANHEDVKNLPGMLK